MDYQALIEKLMQHFTSGKYADEADAAKKEFYDLAGIIDEEAEDFEIKMAQFTDWFVFQRKLETHGVTPVQAAFERVGFEMEPEQSPFYRNLIAVNHSLFEFLKLKDHDVYVKDLISGKKHVIKQSQITIGFSREEIFEARLIPHEDTFVFTHGFCFHPAVATRFITKATKPLKKLSGEELSDAKDQLIMKLFKMRYKHQQYKHVDVKEIYSNEPKIRI